MAASTIRRSLQGMPIRATWDELVSAEPGLWDFMWEARSVEGKDYQTCSDAVWYGWNTRPEHGIKWRLREFIGRECTAFFAAYRAIYGSLTLCRHCLERDPREADIEAHVARELETLGLGLIERQVRTVAGIADIVTPDSVYEIKLWLTRVALFQAIGQVTVYANALDRPNRYIVGQATPGIERLVTHIKLSGINVRIWC